MEHRAEEKTGDETTGTGTGVTAGETSVALIAK